MIDLGANTGQYTKHYAKIVGPTGRVLAVEPHRESCEKLRDAYRDHPHVEIVAAAVARSAHPSMPFWHDVQAARRSSMWYHNVIKPDDDAWFVPTVTLDSLSASVPNLKAIKMDVQGAECHVLDGAEQTLAMDLVWAVELWPTGLANAGRSVEELARRFEEAGYHPTDLRGWCGLLKVLKGFDGHRSTDVILRKAV